MKYKAIIFDLDGTLLDTIDDLADSMNGVLARRGIPTHDVDKYKYFVGDGMSTLVKRALPQDISNDSLVSECITEMREEYGKRWANKSCPYEGIPELLDMLAAEGIKTAILSNKPDEFTKIVVEKLLSRWKFEVVLGERSGIPKKPDPTGAMEIADLLNIPPEEFLYLGDTNTDMLTANAAGMYAVGVLWGFRKADELIKSGAQILLEKPVDLIEVL